MCDAAADFWGIHNKHWARGAKVPPTESRITQAYFIGKQIDAELSECIGADTKRHPKGAIATLLKSWSAWQPESVIPLIQFMTTAVQNTTDIAARIGYLNRYYMNPPITIYMQRDVRDQAQCRVFIDTGEPGIGIPEYWLWPEYSSHRAQYRKYVDRMADIFKSPIIMQGLTAEKAFANALPPAENVFTETAPPTFTWAELNDEFKEFDWSATLIAWGLHPDRMKKMRYCVPNRAFLHHMQRHLTTWPLHQWRGWLALLVAHWAAGLCPPGPLRSAWFSFNRYHMQGIRGDFTRAELRTSIVKRLLPVTLGKLWLNDHDCTIVKKDVVSLVNNIRTAAARRLAATTWLTPTTRRAAVHKLKRMAIEVCWPDDPTPEPAPTSADFITNLQDLAVTDYGCKKERNSWPVPVFEVNAFYYPTENRIIIPAGILRPPFYDPAASIPYNYGAIGATIGHEICHAFDVEGRQYNERGELHNWWSAVDVKEYQARAQRMIRLFQATEYRGMPVDGKMTLIENIADLGGLEFALAGLQQALGGRAVTAAELREFFESYAISWRSKERRRRAAELLARDPHAPPPLRVNLVVRQLDAWYAAYGVTERCAGFIPEERRIRFWSA